jgi:hypothetical protein
MATVVSDAGTGSQSVVSGPPAVAAGDLDGQILRLHPKLTISGTLGWDPVIGVLIGHPGDSDNPLTFKTHGSRSTSRNT